MTATTLLVYGATGYVGALFARSVVENGWTPVLAAGEPGRLTELAAGSAWSTGASASTTRRRSRRR